MLRVCIALLFLPLSLCLGQEKLIKFGRVTLEELKLKHYEKDSTASAVILHDRGHFNGNNFTFTRHVRIKILTSPGSAYANFVVKTPMKSFIDGYTFNLQDGMIVKTKLNNSNIHSEEVIEGFELYKIFFPDVRPGSIIDLEYTHDGLPFEWRFQDKIPVVFSELIVERTQNLFYKKVFYGFEKIKEVGSDHWIAEHVPPITEEPFMSQYANFLTRFQFDIESIAIPRFAYYKDFSTWERVGKRLMELEFFGGVFQASAFLNDRAKELRQSSISPYAKVNEALKFIKDNIKWNNSYGLLAEKSYREDFNRNHSGNSATINLLLISLLKKAGINTYPVVLSTRDNGMINPLSASISKLNYVVGYVKHEDLKLLIDATTPYTTPGVLPEHCLNMSGWVIHPSEGEIIDLNPAKAHVLKQFILIKPNPANELVAEVSNTYEDYAFLDWIKSFEKAGSETSYENEFKSKNKTLDVGDYKLQSIEKDKLKATETALVNLSSSEHLQDIGSDLFINPFILTDIVNPFKSTIRHFPIDFIYPRRRSITISLQLPDGFEIKSVPKSSRTDYPGDKAKFSFLCNAENNRLNIRCDMSISETVFTEDEYEIVKAFFTEVTKKLSESIQIVKRT